MWRAKEGFPPFTHLAKAGGCIASFGNRHTWGRESHPLCLRLTWTLLLLDRSRPRGPRPGPTSPTWESVQNQSLGRH